MPIRAKTVEGERGVVSMRCTLQEAKRLVELALRGEDTEPPTFTEEDNLRGLHDRLRYLEEGEPHG